MDAKTLRRCISKKYPNRNVYLTTGGPRRDRRDLIQRGREYIRDCIEQVRKLEAE